MSKLKNINVFFRIDMEMYQKLEQESTEQGIKLSQLIRQIIEKHLTS